MAPTSPDPEAAEDSRNAASVPSPRTAPSTLVGATASLLALAATGVILFRFHDQFWWPPDEGTYAHIAERILDGEVLNGSVQDIHAGYVDFVNAGALAVFGRSLLSLRYPLVLVGILQAWMVVRLFLPCRPWLGAIASLGVTTLGFVQFLNPTAHWYALFLAIAAVVVLHGLPPGRRGRLELLGFLAGTAILFRQLSGILLTMGVVTYLLAYEPFARGPARQASPAWFARLVLGVIAAGLTTYLVKSTDAFAWILFGIWPLALLVRGIVTTSVPTGTVGTTLARLGAGAAISALPLVVYHTVHGSWGGWLSDTVGAAIALTRLPFMDKRTYAMMMQHAVASLSASVLGAPNALYWLVLPTTAAILGGCAVWRTWRRGATLPAIVVVATFYGVVSVHYQIPFYLAYTAGLSIAACLFLVDSPRRGPRVAAGAAVMAISGTGLWYHAGQPISHGFGGRLGAPDITLVRPAGVPRAGIRVEPSDASLYGALVHLIQSEATPDESIFAVPSHAELYFLAERRNPFRFYNTALGIRTPAELAQVLEVLEHDPPRLVIFDATDKYNTDASLAIMRFVATHYDPVATLAALEVYRSRASRRRHR